MKKQEFEAVIEKPPNSNGAFVVIPFNVAEIFGTKGQVKVKATFDGHPYRGSVVPMGGGQHVLGLRKDIRQAIGKTHGDQVRVVLELDTEPRTVTMPAELQLLLDQNESAKEFFETLSYTHRKEYVGWIESAKKEETRSRRLQKSVQMLLEGMKHP